MTKARSAFYELDSRICRTVKFGDGSVVEIEGRGTILFITKTAFLFYLRIKQKERI